MLPKSRHKYREYEAEETQSGELHARVERRGRAWRRRRQQGWKCFFLVLRVFHVMDVSVFRRCCRVAAAGGEMVKQLLRPSACVNTLSTKKSF